MSEHDQVFITYNITISEQELDTILEMIENEGNLLDYEGAVVYGILEQILDQAHSASPPMPERVEGKENE